ncbi:lactonase family protein [Paenibacillus antibioticophila]|uniref:lactonase family protein n=1 Tax=Paenibacillus antibioticophila TaxID=1274374 RepID=UPI0005C96060|nr:lactonase family protein [Paenibacillus antibioticophila]
MNNINRDDKLLFYVGSYAEESNDGIHLCELDNNTGALQLLHGASGIKNPSFLVVNQDHTRLYAVSEQSEGAVFSYEIDRENGKLTQLARISTEGADPCHLSLDGRGSLYAANYSSGHVNRYVLDERGAAAELAALVQHVGQGFREDRQEAAHAHSIVPDANGRYAYVCDLGLDQIIYYDLSEGKLTTAGEVELPPGSGPRHFLIHPNGEYAYAINELNSTITVFAYNRIQGHLEILQHVSTVPEDFGGENYPADLHLSPDGRYVYGSNRGHDSIVKLTVNLETGALETPEWTCGRINWPRNFAVLERFVLIANQNGDDIAVFRRDPATGGLTATEHGLALKQPSCIAPL